MLSRIAPVHVTSYTATSAVGDGKAALLAALTEHRSGLRRTAFGRHALATWVGQVGGLDAPLPHRSRAGIAATTASPGEVWVPTA